MRIAITALICLALLGCTADKPVVKVDVPIDTVRVVSPVVGQKAYALLGDSIYLVYPFEADCLVAHSEGPNRWRRIRSHDLFPDSLSACRALRERYEKQQRELNEKLKGLCK